ncbi:DUF1003 domain-containing protein [Actinomycetospora callitridis]|uniref:DUF1003 domain-containing protein n=1 Tax=Actinomycetospora callitridis TaxID=913944 RepID=UPI0023670C46|nr:DUF1003 domain-containing protein [Actinomycetospora callitridis]MDD7917403.1 DUF1003 domain-containing protein [Actinomycetospora callitridis]
MPEPSTRRRLDQPAGTRRLRLGVDAEWFAKVAERLARFLGTGTFLLWQSVIVLIWITLNVFAISLQWDPYPFILLNLAFSTQAAYAAPLILLAQNRQDDRDRVSLEEDRTRAGRLSAETEYLARELASMRLQLGEVVTRDYLRGELEQARGGRDGRDDRGGKSDKALEKAVTKAVDRAVDRQLGTVVEQALVRALERTSERASTTDGGAHSNGR